MDRLAKLEEQMQQRADRENALAERQAATQFKQTHRATAEFEVSGKKDFANALASVKAMITSPDLRGTIFAMQNDPDKSAAALTTFDNMSEKWVEALSSLQHAQDLTIPSKYIELSKMCEKFQAKIESTLTTGKTNLDNLLTSHINTQNDTLKGLHGATAGQTQSLFQGLSAEQKTNIIKSGDLGILYQLKQVNPMLLGMSDSDLIILNRKFDEQVMTDDALELKKLSDRTNTYMENSFNKRQAELTRSVHLKASQAKVFQAPSFDEE